MTQRIGVLGGYGAVGSAVVRLLAARFDGIVRVGGRDGKRAEAAADALAAGEAVEVDLWEDAALAAFCRDCAIVVHAGGPSYQVADRVARSAFAAGADYVDAGGDLPLYERLAGTERRALVTAGMMPGLSGLLPRWLARRTGPVRRLEAYVGVLDRLTPAGAVDYLLSLGGRDAESQAVWQDGRRVTRSAAPQVDVRLPFFPGVVSAFPYLGYEPERLARQLAIPDVRWYSVFDGGAAMMATLSRLQGAMSGEGDLTAAAAQLAEAAELDMFGREPYQRMVFTAHPADGSAPATLVAGSRDTSVLTGTVCGLAALQVLSGAVAPGCAFAAEALNAETLVADLRATDALSVFEVLTNAAEPDEAAEEGVL